MTLGTWLIGQKDRGGWVGDLAAVAAKRRGDVEAVSKHMTSIGADGDAFEALEDAEGVAASDRVSRERDARGRFVSDAEVMRRWEAAWRPLEPTPGPTPEQILANPTDAHPRWRLRVFDTTWPWRARRAEAYRDALASGNARRDYEDRQTYLDACAQLQRDPPFYLDRYRMRVRRGEA